MLTPRVVRCGADADAGRASGPPSATAANPSRRRPCPGGRRRPRGRLRLEGHADGPTRTHHHARRGGHRRDPRAKQRAYLHRRAAGGRRPLRAARAAAHRGRGGRRASSSSTATRPHPNTYLGQGKLEELKARDQGAPTRTSSPSTTSSRRARSATSRRSSACPVIDRTAIDPRHLRRPRAHRRGQAPGRARAARVQPRPHARPVDATSSAWARSSGGIGTRGPGESQIETDRRLARDRIAALQAPARATSSATRAVDARRARARAPAAPSRWPATRTPASRRCSTRSPARGRRARPPLPHARPDDALAADRRAAPTC